MEPSTPDQLLELFTQINPHLKKQVGTLTSLFEEYRGGGKSYNTLLKVIRKAEEALTKHSKHRIKLRDVQLMNIIMLTALPETTGWLAEIKTGEGKSNIIKMVAAVRCLLESGKLVDVVTTSETLAIRDAEDPETVAFFKELGLTVGHGVEIETRRHRGDFGGDSPNPLKADVMYGTPSVFEGIYLRKNMPHTRAFYRERLDNLANTHLLVDEVDSMLVDSKSNSTLLSTAGDQSVELLLIQSEICKVMSTKIAQIETEFAQENPHRQQPDRQKAISFPDIARICEAHIRGFAQVNCKLDKTEQAIFDTCYKEWIESCYQALCVRKADSDYVVHNGQIKIVDSSNTGEISKNTRWGSGLHKFLEMKHDLKIGTDTLICHSMSNFKFFRLYGPRLSGLTGTLGLEDTQKFLRDTYGVECYRSPPYRPSQLNVNPTPSPVMDVAQLNAAVMADASEQLRAGRIVLLINKDITSCKEFVSVAETVLRQEFPSLNIVEYFDSAKEGIEETLTGLKEQTLIVASNLAGRGTDIEISDEIEAKGGLHVIITFLPQNSRVRQQAEGRAGRKGQKGSANMVYMLESYQASKISESGITEVSMYSEKLNEINQDRQETLGKLLMERAQFEVDYHTMMDEFYHEFVGLMNQYPKVEENPVSSKQVSNDYAQLRLILDCNYRAKSDEIQDLQDANAAKAHHGALILKTKEEFREKFRRLKQKCSNADDKGRGYAIVSQKILEGDSKSDWESSLAAVKSELRDDPNNLELQKIQAALLINLGRENEAKEIVERLKSELVARKLFMPQIIHTNTIGAALLETNAQIADANFSEEQLKIELQAAALDLGQNDAVSAVDLSMDGEVENNEEQTADHGHHVGPFSEVATTQDIAATVEQEVQAQTQDQMGIISQETRTQAEETSSLLEVNSQLAQQAEALATQQQSEVQVQQKAVAEANRKAALLESKKVSIQNRHASMLETAQRLHASAELNKNSSEALKEGKTSVDYADRYSLQGLESHIEEISKLESALKAREEGEKETQFEFSPDSKLQIKKKEGYLGYILGFMAIIGGVAVGVLTGNWMLGADIIMGGIDLCVENYEMNKEGTYSAWKIVKRAAFRTATIVATASLDKIFDSLSSIKSLTPEFRQTLKTVQEFQKKLQHPNIQTMMANRMVQFANDHKELLDPAIGKLLGPHASALMGLATGSPASYLYALESWLTSEPSSELDEKAEKKKLGDSLVKSCTEQRVREREEQLRPAQQQKVDQKIRDGPATQMAVKIVQQIQEKLKTLPKRNLFSRICHPASFKLIKDKASDICMKLARIPSNSEVYKVYDRPSSDYDTNKQFEPSDKFKTIFNDQFSKITELWSRDMPTNTSIRVNTKPADSGARTAKLQDDLKNLMEQQKHGILTPAQVQEKQASITQELSKLNQQKLDQQQRDKAFEPVFVAAVEAALMRALDSPSGQRVEWSLEQFKQDTQAESDRFREKYCTAVHPELLKQLQAGKKHWDSMLAEWPKDLAQYMVSDIKAQLSSRSK